MLRPRIAFPSLLLLLASASCDNIGRVFDPSVGSPPTTGSSAISIIQVGGDSKGTKPTVKATYPTGSGWQPTVPIVVEFSESVNERSVGPSTATAQDAKILLRLKGTTARLPCSYDFLANGRLLVMRPQAPLSPPTTPTPTPPTPAPPTVTQTYEVVLLPDARDADGIVFDAPTAGTVLAEFQPNQAASQLNGRILAVFPRDNAKDAMREADTFVVFDRPANAATLVAANLQLRPTGDSALAATVATPVATLGVADPRIVRLRVAGGLVASTQHELVVNNAITFGATGTLDFGNRTPFARFTTVGPAALTQVQLDNALPGFPNKVNRANLETAQLRVITPADAVAGDRVRARIYGGNSATAVSGDLKFVERTAVVPEPGGALTVLVDFTGRIGSVANPGFDDGELTFAAQLQRGSQSSGFIRNASNAEPSLDAKAPTVTRAGPPGSDDGRDVYFDTAHLAFHGLADEEIAEASLTDGVNPATSLFASDEDGNFVIRPILIARLAGPRSYVLTATDSSGNLVATPFGGNLVQRGYCTGAFAGRIDVEAYDQVTLRPIAGATVLLDAGVPSVPAVGQLVATTDAAGRAVFTGLGAGPFTVTIARDGYDLISLYRTQAAIVSLPLRPRTGATATMQGSATFTPGAGVTAIIGNSAFDDRGQFGARTSPSAATTIPDTAIVPNRAQVLTAFAGVFEPTATPTFSSQGIQMGGATLVVPTPPARPAAPGALSPQALTLLPGSSATVASLPAAVNKDFSAAIGLNVGTLQNGRPLVRVTASVQGYEGQVLAGMGFTTGSGPIFPMIASYSLPLFTLLAPFSPTAWLLVEARDGDGNLSRLRLLLLPALNSTFEAVPLPPPSIPTITPPGGASTGSPAVTFVDPADPALIISGLSMFDVCATDATGRKWTLLVPDRDGVGFDTVQFPDLNTAGVLGLATGNWSVRVDARVMTSLTGETLDDLVFSERTRLEVSSARAASVTFQVQ